MNAEMRHILITGTSRGLGRGMAEYFLEKGDRVFGCARFSATLEHHNYTHFTLDLRDEKAVAGLFGELRKKAGCLDALINNAGIARMNAFALTPLKSLRETIEVNLYATFLVSQKAIPLLRKSPSPSIVNFTTVAVPLNLEGESAYAASKAAVETLTRIMAKELAPFGIRCNAVGPSPIKTDLIKGVPKEKIERLVKEAQAIKRMASVEDVINVVEFFMSPRSRMITGQTIYLGGIS